MMHSLNFQTFTPVLPSARPTQKAAVQRRQAALPVRASFAVAENAASNGNGAANSNSAAIDKGLSFQVNDAFPPSEPEPVSPEVQAIIDEQGLDYKASGLKYLTNDARVSSLPCPRRCMHKYLAGVIHCSMSCKGIRCRSNNSLLRDLPPQQDLSKLSFAKICSCVSLLHVLPGRTKGMYAEPALDVQKRALDKKANKIEKLKNKKGGQAMWSEVHELGQLIR